MLVRLSPLVHTPGSGGAPCARTARARRAAALAAALLLAAAWTTGAASAAPPAPATKAAGAASPTSPAPSHAPARRESVRPSQGFDPGLGVDADAAPWPRDPVYVYYPRAGCRGDEAELELWNRRARSWQPHPGHARVPLESCQLEDAGTLLNEIRWRCVERDGRAAADPGHGADGGDGAEAGWVEGVAVFDPHVMERCAVTSASDGFGDLRIHISSPAGDRLVQAPAPRVAVEGAVLIGGLQGAEYDVVLAIDTASALQDGEDMLAAQLDAARAFVRSVKPRLGDARIAIVSFPNLRPRRGESTAARRELPFTTDARRVEATLAALRRRGTAGGANLVGGLRFALGEFARDERDVGGPRRSARRLLLIAGNGRAGGPLDPARRVGDQERAQLEALGESAHELGVAVHLFALGGVPTRPAAAGKKPAADASASPRDRHDRHDPQARQDGREAQAVRAAGHEGPPAALAALVVDGRGSFTRVPRPTHTTDYLLPIRLPYVAAVSVRNQTTGLPAERTTRSPGGAFRAVVPVAFGRNRIHVEAETSDGRRVALDHELEFDGSLVRQRLLEAERRRLARRRRDVRVEPERAPR